MLVSDTKTLLLTVLGVLLLTAIFSSKGALQDVHWDAPIYLERARAYAETPYLASLATNAAEIAERLRFFKADQGETTPYWGFIRLGNTILLGTLTAALGSSTQTIQVASWLYTAFLLASLVLAADLSLRLIAAFGLQAGRRAAVVGVLISVGLYLGSDICRYLAGNLVAEVPALFLLAGSALALVKALTSRSVAWAVASGLAAFLLYVVKMDAVWAYLSFLFLANFAIRIAAHDPLWWRMPLCAALTAAALYGAYALWFWPLADPWLIVVFQGAQDETARNPISPVKLWAASGGLLWIGLLLALLYARKEKLLWLAMAWLLINFLPYAPSAIEGRPMQVRMFALTMVPLLVVSTVGWAMFVENLMLGRVRRAVPWLLGAFLVAGIGVSQAESYSLLRQYPGAWRLQYLKEWLSPPRYERLSYPVADLERISAFIYSDSRPTALVIDRQRNEQFLGIVHYLRPAGVDGSASAVRQRLICGREQPLPVQRFLYCVNPPEPEELRMLGTDARVMYLYQAEGMAAGAASIAAATVYRAGSLSLLAAERAPGPRRSDVP
jgi:hypothetical protein